MNARIAAAAPPAVERWQGLWLIVPPVLVLMAVSAMIRSQVSGVLVASLRGAAALLALGYFVLALRAHARGRALETGFVVVRTHYVQALLLTTLHLIWASAWAFEWGQFPLIAAQIAFAYGCTLLLGWARRGHCEVGFGPIPIILSTNFFMCFKDEWFFLQFAMIAFGLAAKEFIRWTRDGRSTHVFNPSAFSLFVFSLALLASGQTQITWAPQIATELIRPPHIYFVIFAVGLVVQYLFEVTLVTLAAGLALWLLGLAYTGATGIYWFLDSGIPIAVFLGIHLLITDPATSPRDNLGRFVFGALYGTSAFLLYGALEHLGQPRFYDKLLCVPLLNLLVPLIDGWARRVPVAAFGPFAKFAARTPRQLNLAFMGVWVLLFATMVGTHTLGPDHPGLATSFWERACDAKLHNGCRNLQAIHRDDCFDGNADACLAVVDDIRRRGADPGQPQQATYALARGCDLGRADICPQFAQALAADGGRAIAARCSARDAEACYLLGSAHMMGYGVASDHAAGYRYFAQSCDLGLPKACGVTAQTYLYGVGTPRDVPRALAADDRACAGGQLAACMELGQFLVTGSDAVPRDERRGLSLFARACHLGLEQACRMN